MAVKADKPPKSPTRLERASDGLTVTDAAKELGVHHQTIRNWIRNGDLPVNRFGPNAGMVRIHPDDLAAMRHQ